MQGFEVISFPEKEKENSAGFRGTKTKDESFFYFSKANRMFSRAEFAVLMAYFFSTFFEVISANFRREKFFLSVHPYGDF